MVGSLFGGGLPVMDNVNGTTPSPNAWVSPALPPWVSSVEESLLRIAALGPGWDGEQAEPMSWRALDSALMVLVETMSNDTVSPQIVPTYDGGLQLEWHCAGVDLEVYIQPNGQVSAWLQEAGREWELNRYPCARLSRLLEMLLMPGGRLAGRFLRVRPS